MAICLRPATAEDAGRMWEMLCRLYEIMGYQATGYVTAVNERMTLVRYEKA